ARARGVGGSWLSGSSAAGERGGATSPAPSAGVMHAVAAAASGRPMAGRRRVPSPPVIAATAPTLITAATAIRGLLGSRANAQPSSTATTGLTYAYVETRAGVLTPRSHVYAVNPTSEPNTMR